MPTGACVARLHVLLPSVRNGAGLPDSTDGHLSWACSGPSVCYSRVTRRTDARRRVSGWRSSRFPKVSLDNAVDSLARRMAALPPELLAQSKAVINRAIDLMGREQLQRFAIEANSTARQSPGVAEWSRVLGQGSPRSDQNGGTTEPRVEGLTAAVDPLESKAILRRTPRKWADHAVKLGTNLPEHLIGADQARSPAFLGWGRGAGLRLHHGR